MAIAAEELAGPAEASAFRAASAASGKLRQLPSAAQSGYQKVSSPGRTAQTITKLIWAAALGLIVLQIAAEATGQQWGLNLGPLGSSSSGQKFTKGSYRPLYGSKPARATGGATGGAAGGSSGAFTP